MWIEYKFENTKFFGKKIIPQRWLIHDHIQILRKKNVMGKLRSLFGLSSHIEKFCVSDHLRIYIIRKTKKIFIFSHNISMRVHCMNRCILELYIRMCGKIKYKSYGIKMAVNSGIWQKVCFYCLGWPSVVPKKYKKCYIAHTLSPEASYKLF